MRNDLTACDRPQLANAAPIGRGGLRRRRVVRALLALPLALALIAPGATALATGTTTGYRNTQAPPKTQKVPAPKQETAPTRTSSTAKETPASANGPTEASSETATAAKAKTLPFTGLDLRWVTLGGLLLVGMGMSIMVVQRRRHSAGR